MAGAAVSIRIDPNAAASQSALAGTAVDILPSVIIEDVDGLPVPGQTVTFAVTGGGGSRSPATVQSDVNGIATLTDWTLGATPGTNTLTATAAGLTGSPVTFTAEGTAPPAATIEANSAVTQSTPVGTNVSTPPSALVKDTLGAAKQGITVMFFVVAGGGSISEVEIITDAFGVATLTSWTAGPTAGTEINVVHASVPGLSGDPVLFKTTGTAGAAASIEPASPTEQTGPINTAVAVPPAARVRDTFGNPVAGHPVTFAPTAGGGSVDPVTAVNTGADGIATATSWTLGGTAGANSATATATGLAGSPVTYNATATNAPTTIAANSTTSQTAGTSTHVGEPPSVLVTGAGSAPIEGVPVIWAVPSGGGSLVIANGTTDKDGISRLQSWTTGSAAGANSVTATVSGLAGSPVTFNATGATLTADSITAISATSQTGAVSAAVGARPAVLVADPTGLPVAGHPVTFDVMSGNGVVVPAGPSTVLTGPDGIARATSWTLGAALGTNNNSVTATAAGLTGSPVTFVASGVAGPAASIAAFSAQLQSAPIGTAVAVPPAVRVVDAGGNPVVGHPVTFTPTLGDGSIAPAAPAIIPTDGNGVAALTRWTLGSTVGASTNQVAASAIGLTGSPVVFAGSGTGGGAPPVSSTPRAPFERIDVATDLICNGGQVVATVMGLVEARVEHRFEGIVRIPRLTVRYTRDLWDARGELTEHRVLLVRRTDGDYDEYRVTDAGDMSGADGLVTVQAVHPIQDLGLRGSLITSTTGGLTSLTVPISGRTLAALLVETILPRAPSYFGLGVMPPGVVTVTLSEATPLSGTVAATEGINKTQNAAHEISARRNGTTNYLIDVAVVGQNAPLADIRTGKNLLRIERQRAVIEQRTQATIIDPTGRTLGDNAWEVVAVAAGVSIEVASITGGLGPSLEADQLKDLAWMDEAGTAHAITSSVVVSDTVTRLLMASTIGIVVGDWGRLAANTSGDDLALLTSPNLIARWGPIHTVQPGQVPSLTNWIRNPRFAVATDGLTPDDWTLPTSGWALATTQSFGGGRVMEFTGISTAKEFSQTRSVFFRKTGAYIYSVWYMYPGAGGAGATLKTTNPQTGAVDSLPLPGFGAGDPLILTWVRVDVTYQITTTGVKTIRLGVDHAANLSNTNPNAWIGGAQFTEAPAIDFLEGSGGATNHQAVLEKFRTDGDPITSYQGALADLTRLDPTSWPYDTLHHGGIIDVTDDELGETFAPRIVELTEDLLNPADSRPTLATAPRRISTIIRSGV